MAFCTNCGRSLVVNAQFCTGCGSPVGPPPGGPPGGAAEHSVIPSHPAAPAYATTSVGPPRRAGRLAFKGFVLAFIGSFVLAMLMHSNPRGYAIALLLAYGGGAAYILLTMRAWRAKPERIKGAAIANIIGGVLLLPCLAGLFGMFADPKPTTTAASQEIPVRLDPKEVLLRDVQLDFNWRKEGFGNVMEADFTVKNPTSYGFKDFKIKCRHAAASGTDIDSNTITLYEVVSPNSTRKFRKVNMGFIHGQAASSGCRITDLTAL